MDELRAAVESGLVSVNRMGRGFIVTGAVNDMLVLADLEALGAVWKPDEEGYYIENAEAAREMERLRGRTRAVFVVLRARREQAAKDGAILFDAQREKQQRAMARELRDVYQKALDEHKEELRRIIARYESAQDPAEAMKLAYRRDELESLIEALASSMANAGAAAAALTDAKLAEASAISKEIARWQLDNMAGFRVSRFIANDTASLALTGVATYHGKYDLKAWQGVANKNQARKIIKQTISRGLLTGEHPSNMAKRMEGLFTGETPLSPCKRAIRIAQTEAHSVMNQAALETMHEATASGLKMKKRWDATLDGSTRKDHRKVDGEVVAVNKPFSNGLMKPGDGGAADRINCRCALVEVLDGFEPDANLRRDNVTKQNIPYMTYEEWAKANGMEPAEDLMGIYKKLDDETTNTYNVVIKHTNPNYSKGRQYQINCQRCIYSYEARRRGYDVIAKPNTAGLSGRDHLASNGGWAKVMKDTSYFDCEKISGQTASSVMGKFETRVKEFGEGARCVVRCSWRGRRSGHVFIAENVNGKVHFIDPQTGNEDCSEYFELMTLKGSQAPTLLRIDDREFSELIHDCIEDAGRD